MEKPTIYDVARLANVSPATVSRFINKSSAIDKSKSIQIKEAISTLNYQPREPRPYKDSLSIGVLLTTCDCPFSNKILTGINHYANQTRSQLVIETSDWDPQQEISRLKYFRKLNLDGVIVVLGHISTQDTKQILGNTPVIFTCRRDSAEANTLNINNLIGGKLATNHLLQLGHHRIAHITGPSNVFDSQCRLQGYRESLTTAGLEIDDELIVEGDFSMKSGFAATQQLLTKGVSFSAIFAANDHTAFGAIQALDQSGLKVPCDISVIGFDDHPMCPFFIPQLTTIKQPLFELGLGAFSSLRAHIQRKPSNISLPPFELIIRKSTAARNPLN
ncbi:LacI family DNA-binding transcriptional regulator [Photobacterium sanctipauli]|nr:substrate-binding domain-containing protein [Photobacterium sanctipauli]